jgi:lambda repressor-like predicted transcriptional regulator
MMSFRLDDRSDAELRALAEPYGTMTAALKHAVHVLWLLTTTDEDVVAAHGSIAQIIAHDFAMRPMTVWSFRYHDRQQCVEHLSPAVTERSIAVAIYATWLRHQALDALGVRLPCSIRAIETAMM